MKILILIASFFVFSQAQASDSNFAANVGLSWGWGKMYNALKSIPVRTVNTINLSALPGYKIDDSIIVGAAIQIRRVAQNTEPVEVRNQNLRGFGYLLGIGGIYNYEKWKFTGSFDFFGRHKLSNLDSLSRESIYKNPRGITLGAGYKVWDDISGDFIMSYHAFKRNDLAGTENDISGNSLKHYNLALGLSYLF